MKDHQDPKPAQDPAADATPELEEVSLAAPGVLEDDDFLSPELVRPVAEHLPPVEVESPSAAPQAPEEDIPVLEIPETWEVDGESQPIFPLEPSAPAPEIAQENALPGHAPEAPLFPEPDDLPPTPEAADLEPPIPPHPPEDEGRPEPRPEALTEELPQEGQATEPEPIPTAPPIPQSSATQSPMPTPAPRPQLPLDATRRHQEMVLETAGGRFLLREGTISPMEPGRVPSTWTLWLADGPSIQGPASITVDGAPKYAPLLAQRLLQRSGELTDDALLKPLTIKKLSKTRALLAYRIMSRAEGNRLLELHHRSGQGLLLHDAASFLTALLLHRTPKTPTAAILHLPGSLTAVVVQGQHVLWARRQMLAAESGPLWEESSRILLADIHQAGQSSGFQVGAILWVTGLAPHRDLPDGPFTPLPVLALQGPDGVRFSALPLLLPQLAFGPSLTPVPDRLAALLRPWEIWSAAAALILGLGLGAGGILLQHQAAQFHLQANALAGRKGELLTRLEQTRQATQFSPELTEQAQRVWNQAQRIRRAEASPPPAALWNELARIKPASCRLLTLEMAYDGPTLRLSLTGGMELPMTQAQAVFDAFLADLRQAGYQVAAADLRFDMDGNAFSLTIERTFLE